MSAERYQAILNEPLLVVMYCEHDRDCLKSETHMNHTWSYSKDLRFKTGNGHNTA